MKRFSRFVVFVVLAGLPIGSNADDADWQAGFARRNITPQQPVFMAGYASRNRPNDSIESELFVKALALEDADGKRAVLITSDIIGYRRGASEIICERIQSQSALERADILLNSSHTHTGPSLLLDADDRSDSMSLEQAETQIAWTQRLIDLTAEAALEAFDNLQPAKLSYGIGLAPFVMNRREWTPSGIKLGFNPGGYADRAVPTLRIDTPDGTLRGVLFGAATHNTTLGGQHYFICGDYAGFSQEHVEREHPGVTAMFMLGCAGSGNPYPRGALEFSRQHGETLGTEVCRILETELVPIRGPIRTTFETVDLPLQTPPSREQIDRDLALRSGWRPRVAKVMLEALETGKSLPTEFPFPLSVWQFGEDLTLVGLSGEVVGEFVPLIQRAVGPGQLWTTAYCHDVFGYLPTAQVLEDGGYETRGAYYRGPGFFSAEAETVLVDHVRRMTAEVGRPEKHFQDELPAP